MSGSLIGGVIGAVIGYFIPGVGPQLGFMIGSAIGGVLFPPAGPDGPRLQDLKPQASEYGRPIPIVYGTTAIGGNVIWASDLVERAEEVGGKGGDSAQTYSYYGNFAVAICEGTVTLGRIWAGPEKRLIYDPTAPAGEQLEGGTLTFYNGSTTQTPNPLMESFEGVGNVPAYRGVAYLVFQEFPLANDGNMIPMLTVEVGQVTVNTTDLALGTRWTNGTVFVDTARDHYITSFSGGLISGIVIRKLSDNSFVAHYEYNYSDFSETHSFFDSTRNRVVHISSSVILVINLNDGSVVATWGNPGIPGMHSDYRVICGTFHNNEYVFLANESSFFGTDGAGVLRINPDELTAISWNTGDTGNSTLVAGFCDAPEGATYVLGVRASDSTVRKYPLSTPSFTSTSAGTAADQSLPAADRGSQLDPNTGYVWTASFNSGTGFLNVTCVNPATNTTLYNASVSTLAQGFGFQGSRRHDAFVFRPYAAGQGGKVVLIGARFTGGQYYDLFTEFHSGQGPTAPSYSAEYVGVDPRGSGGLTAGWWNPTGTTQYWFIRTFLTSARPRLNDNDLTHVAQSSDVGAYPTSFVYLGDVDGQLVTAGQALSFVIGDLCTRAGLGGSAYDVTALASDTVDGYAIMRQTTVREAIQALVPAFYFDGVESDTKIKFVKRGGAVAATIANDELAAHDAGGDQKEPLETRRLMENEMPNRLFVNYILRNSNYSPASKYAARLTGSSGDEQTIEVPFVVTDTKAQEIAEVNLHGTWIARTTYKFCLPRKYSYLEPTDVVAVHGYTMRLTRVAIRNGRLECEAIHDDSNVYVPQVVVTETPAPDDSVAVKSLTTLELM